MIDTNRTGADAGRYLFTPFETSTAGVMRVDTWTNTTQILVAPGTQGLFPATLPAGRLGRLFNRGRILGHRQHQRPFI